MWKKACDIEAQRKRNNLKKRWRKTKVSPVAWSPPVDEDKKSIEKDLKSVENPLDEKKTPLQPWKPPTSKSPISDDDDDERTEEKTIRFLDLTLKPLPKDMKRKYLAAKKLVNLGELSKAMSQFKTIGVAPMTPLVREEVRTKFEKVDIPPSWPEPERVRERRRSGREGIESEELKDVIPCESEYIPPEDEWWKYHQTITANDILSAIAKIRRTTAGGLNGVTPWQYKKAIEFSPSNSLANTLAGLANRIGRNHLDTKIGATWAAGRLIPLI